MTWAREVNERGFLIRVQYRRGNNSAYLLNEASRNILESMRDSAIFVNTLQLSFGSTKKESTKIFLPPIQIGNINLYIVTFTMDIWSNVLQTNIMFTMKHSRRYYVATVENTVTI